MIRPQSAILSESRENALYLILRVERHEEDARRVADAVASVPGFVRSLERERRARLVGTVALGRALWDAVSPDARPEGFTEFRAMRDGRREAPATGGDLLLHAASREPGPCLDLAQRFRDALGKRVKVLEEVQAFRYRDYRDLTGFIDGTANPSGRRRAAAALLPEGHPFAGGSFVFTQRYVFRRRKWEKLSTEEQEWVIGRRKETGRELPDRDKPPSAHIARVEIEEQGRELEILRHGLPYGATREQGAFFLAYTRDLAIPTRMLSRMIGTSGDGHHDRLLRYVRAKSGAHFFAPSLDTLRRL